MNIRKTQNIIFSKLLLLVFLFYLSVLYSHSIIIIHDITHHADKNSGFDKPEKFDCSLFHDYYFEFNGPSFENWVTDIRIDQFKILTRQNLLIKLFTNSTNPRAPPVFT